MRRRLAALAAVAGGLVVTGSALAETVDRIVAVVGKEIVLLSEVDEEVYLARLRNAAELETPEQVDAYRSEVLKAKIEEKILLEKARAEGIEVTRDEVDEAVGRMIDDIRSRFPDEDEFLDQLAKEDMTVDDLRRTYRKRVEEQLMVRQVMDRLVRSRVHVDERDIQRYWDEHRGEIPSVPAALELRRILVSFAGRAGVDSAAVARAEIVRRRLQNGEDFATLASVFSEGPRAEQGGDLGWFRASDLEPRLGAAVESLQPGETSEVVVTGRGAHLLRVEERRDDGEMHLRQIVFLRDEKAARAAARARAENLLRRVREGESFADVAQAESDDEVTRAAGGYLGKVPVEALGAAFRDKLEALQPGDISDIVEDEEGLSIFEVDGKEGERPPTFDDVHDRLASLLEQRQAKEIYLEIIDEARQEVYVENRLASEG